jgi:hypothetical protein
MFINTSESYTRAYPTFTKLSYTPELKYFIEKAGLESFNVTIDDAFKFLNSNRLFNMQIIGDILMNKTPSTYEPTFTNQ